jgi:hypothetical protein
LDISVSLVIVFDEAAVFIEEDALEVYPDGNDDDVGISYDCSIEADECLQIDAGDVDKIADDDEDSDVDKFKRVSPFVDVDVEDLEEADSACLTMYLEIIMKRGKTLPIWRIMTI